MVDTPRVKVSASLDTKDALVVACFPSVSHVSSIVAHYLIERLELDFVGGVLHPRFPPVALVQEGKPMPPVRVYAGKPVCNMDTCDNVVVIVSEAPVPARMCLPLSEALLEFSKQGNFRAGILIDAFSHQQQSGHEVVDDDDTDETLLGIGATDWAREQLENMEVTLLSAGMIAGMSGVLRGEGRRRKLDMMCILAEAAGNIPDARAAARVIEKLNALLPAIHLDPEPLVQEAERIEEQIKMMIAHQLGAEQAMVDDEEVATGHSMLYG